MVNVIANINGVIAPAKVKKGVLVNPRTGMPYIRKKSLVLHPNKEQITLTLKAAQDALSRELELADEWRTYQERVTELPPDIQADVRRLLVQGSKWEFADLREEVGDKSDVIWKAPEINDLFFSAPKRGLIPKKILEGDLNFTPEESVQLTRYCDYFARTGNLEMLITLDPIKPGVASKSFPVLLKGIAGKETVEEDTLHKLQELLKDKNLTEIVRTGNYLLLRIAIGSNNKPITKLFFESLPVSERKSLLSKDHFKFLQEAVEINSIAVTSLLETLPDDFVAGLLLGNNSTLFRNACSTGKEKSAQAILEIASKLNLKKKGNVAEILIKRSIYETCADLVNRTNGLDKARGVKEKKLEQIIASPHPALNRAIFTELLKIAKIAAQLEGNNDSIENAYKLALIFDDYNVAIKWLENKTSPTKVQSAQPMHDALLFSLPRINNWTPKLWKNLLLKNGDSVLDYISIAPELEEKYKEVGGEKVIGLRFENLKASDLKSLAMRVHYKRESENPEFAVFCLEIKPRVTQEGFELGLGALKHVKDNPQIVEKDQIPDIGVIDGTEIGHKEYYMRKLSKEDPMDLMIALTIGRFVHCCNHIDGATKAMAIAQITSQYGGVYALFKKNNGMIDFDSLPVAKTTVWRITPENKFSNLTFNSWEFRDADKEIKELSKDFIVEAAKRAIVVDQTIARVRLGGQYSFDFEIDTPGNAIDPKTASYDSKTQHLVFSADMLEKSDVDRIRNKLSKKEPSIVKLQAHTHRILEEVKHGKFPLKIAS